MAAEGKAGAKKQPSASVETETRTTTLVEIPAAATRDSRGRETVADGSAVVSRGRGRPASKAAAVSGWGKRRADSRGSDVESDVDSETARQRNTSSRAKRPSLAGNPAWVSQKTLAV